MLSVLIADDEPKIIQLISHLVNWEDYHMEVKYTAKNGSTALQIILEQKPDLVITDIRMPNINGIDLVKQAKSAGISSYFIIVSGYSDFEYAQQAIKLGVDDYLLKPVSKEDLDNVLINICDKYQVQNNIKAEREQLLSTLSQNKDTLKKHLLFDILTDNDTPLLNATSEELSSEYGLNLTGDSICCLAVHIFIQEDSSNESSVDEIKYLTAKIQQDLQSRLDKICKDMICMIDGKDVIFLINYDLNQSPQIDNVLYKFHSNILDYKCIYPDIRLSVCRGTSTDNLPDFINSYKGCLRGLEYRFIYTDYLIPPVQEKASAYKKNAFTENDKKELHQAIELLSPDNLRTFLVRLQPLFSMIIATGDSVYPVLKLLVDSFLYEIHSLNIESVYEKFSTASLLSCLEDYFSFSDVYANLVNNFCEILNECREVKNNTEELPIRLARSYIQEHYHESLTLNDVSNVAGFSPTYFSTLFRKFTGSTFMDYLTEVRINNAKSLLLNTTYDIADICIQVGYSDTKYFTKQFKKNTHITPLEFRKLHGNRKGI